MKELVTSKEFWIWVFGIIITIGAMRALYAFNRFILFVVILVAGILTVLYVQPDFLSALWPKE